MAKVLTHMCMSLDGFVAQPDDNPAELFDWYWGGDVVVPSAQESMSFSVDTASAQMLRELTSGCGALVAGRRLFDDPGHLVRLRLTDSTTFETGAVRLFLEPDHD